MNKDLVTNLSTALMAVKDMATYNDIPIEMHFENHYIHIFVGYGTPYQKYVRYYPQDCYRMYSQTDDMRKWIEDALEEIQKEKSELKTQSKEMVEIGETIRKGLEEGMKKAIDPAERATDTGKAMRDIMDKLNADGYRADWTPPELEELGIPYPATMGDIEKALKIEHLLDVTCSWQVEELCDRRLYMLIPGCTLDDLTPYERHLLKWSAAYEQKRQEREEKE